MKDSRGISSGLRADANVILRALFQLSVDTANGELGARHDSPILPISRCSEERTSEAKKRQTWRPAFVAQVWIRVAGLRKPRVPAFRFVAWCGFLLIPNCSQGYAFRPKKQEAQVPHLTRGNAI